ncbi:hypothetical protein ACFYW6_39360 [Streptomyces sp. NPDC002659]|uniref:hypothetical protein n=1 Tax=Streptomyces sp. NPDC002659 TaxID=3364656 RepID=UPI0036BE4C69
MLDQDLLHQRQQRRPSPGNRGLADAEQLGRRLLAEFIRELIVAGTNEALAAVRVRGLNGGRPSTITPELIRAARDMLPNPDTSIESIAKLLGVSAGTLYNHIPYLRELRTSRGFVHVQRQHLSVRFSSG